MAPTHWDDDGRCGAPKAFAGAAGALHRGTRPFRDGGPQHAHVPCGAGRLHRRGVIGYAQRRAAAHVLSHRGHPREAGPDLRLGREHQSGIFPFRRRVAVRRPDRGRLDGWQNSNLRELQQKSGGCWVGKRDWGGVAEHQVRHRLRVQSGDQARGDILGRRADSIRHQELEREVGGRLHLRRR